LTALQDISRSQSAPDAAENVRFTVCIASIGRQELLDTLESLVAIKRPERSTLDVLIADDTKNGRIAASLPARLCAALAISCIHVDAQNVAIARNACLDHATGDFLVFLDDDERAAPDWLCELYAAARKYSADAVFGSVVAKYPSSAPWWLIAADPFSRHYDKHGEKVEVGATCNALVRRSAIEKTGLRFDAQLGKSGGEDSDFFYRLARSGGALSATGTALVFETISEQRIDPAYMRQRFIRGGQTYAKLSRKYMPRQSDIVFSCVVVAKIGLLSCAYFFLRFVRRDIAFLVWSRLMLNVGKLLELRGVKIPELY
jgi:succinoglycan biosynthesis protein ExoM